MKKFTFNGVLAILLLLQGYLSFSQPGQPIIYQNGDYRSRHNVTGATWHTSAGAWEVYDATTGTWSDVTIAAPSPQTRNFYIRDGVVQNLNASYTINGKLKVGEGNAATATTTIDATTGAVTSVAIVNPGKLVVIPPVLIFGRATTLAVATVTSVKITDYELVNQGSGYSTATVTFGDAPAGGTTATGTAILTGNKVTGITIVNAGSGYTSMPVITITGDGTGATARPKIGIEALTISDPGSGYIAPPQVVLGSLFVPGSLATGTPAARTITINGDLEFKGGGQIASNNSINPGVSNTVIISGNLYAVSAVNFIMSGLSTTSQTNITFNGATPQIAGGGTITVRNLILGTTTILTTLSLNASTLNIAGTTTLNSISQIDANNGTIGYVTYSTPVAQTIGATTFKDALVRNLTISNISGVTSNQSFSVTNLLRLDSGILSLPIIAGTTQTPVTLQLNGTNTVAGTFGSTSHIRTAADAATGVMSMVQLNNVAASRTLPLGFGGNYLPVTINPASVSTFTASVFVPATDNGTPNGTATADKTNIVDAIYNVNRIAGSGNTTLMLGFPASLKGSGFASIQNYQLGISRYNGSTWETPVGNGNNTQNFAQAAFASFSPFRVAVNLNAVPLPVKLGDVYATKVNNTTKLSWKVYTEVNAAFYSIERSIDGRSFTAIGNVTAQGKQDYTFSDNSPVFGKNLYRIKIVDKNNSFTYSKVLLVDFNLISSSDLVIAPNPVTEGYFTVKLSKLNAGKVSVTLFNNAGQSILVKRFSFNGNVDTELISLPVGIAKGIYRLVISDGVNTQKTTVVVQ